MFLEVVAPFPYPFGDACVISSNVALGLLSMSKWTENHAHVGRTQAFPFLRINSYTPASRLPGHSVFSPYIMKTLAALLLLSLCGGWNVAATSLAKRATLEEVLLQYTNKAERFATST